MRSILLVALAACSSTTPPPVVSVGNCTTTGGANVTARRVAYGCGVANAKAPNCMAGSVTLVTSPPNDQRLFALEQTGRIRIIDKAGIVPAPFLDLSGDSGGPVVAGGEQGLLGLAFHPQYATNHQFYVYYTAANPGGGTDWLDVVARYTTSATDPNVADPKSATIVLAIPDKFTNHNGGMIEFGADGFLYIGNGDGGSGNDPDNNGQNPNELLAKILRIDVDHPTDGKPYGIPAGNPFKASGGSPEILIMGVRNPWRWSFDRMTGDLWIGEVGQGTIEEVDVLAPAEQAGANLGWSMFEGHNCFKAPCDETGKTFPLDSRTHASGWAAIIGGQVYRGACYPDLVGWYFYTDNARAGLVKAKLKDDRSGLDIVELPGTFPQSPASIHADATGELFETDTAGNIWHLEAAP